MNKKLFWGVIAILFVGVSGYFYNQKNDEFKLITDEEEMTEFVINHTQEEYEEYLANVDELKANDLYGGETPEETLELYITALKDRNFELASKYFRLEDQAEELKELVELNNDTLITYVKFIDTEDRKITYNKPFDTYWVDVVSNGENILIAKLVKNKQTNKWKLKSL